MGLLFTYGILRLQHILPVNLQGLSALSPGLAFNTAVSSTTNTNWQSYGGESAMSYFSQMVGLTIHNFTSAAVGISVAAALVRRVSRHSATSLGNFWVDITRTTYYLLLPLCLVFAVFLVAQGTIQNFKAYDTAILVEPQGEVTTQTIAQGSMASQAIIKMLGTNGGGFTNANAPQPFGNPTLLWPVLHRSNRKKRWPSLSSSSPDFTASCATHRLESAISLPGASRNRVYELRPNNINGLPGNRRKEPWFPRPW